MAPWPEQGNEPKAPDKSCGKSGDNNLSDSSNISSATTEDSETNNLVNKPEDKQEEKNPDVSNLDDGQLKALLDEAITYKRPKDREGKSHLFRELLQEAEADESACGDGCRTGGSSVPEQVVQGSRYYSNSKRRGRRDPAVSERQTRGGSLQNLVHAIHTEFDSSGFGYFGQSSGHGSGVVRRKSSKRGSTGRDYTVSVSARQREGGSLPSNVNVGGACGGGGGGMLTLSGLEFPPTAPLSSAATAALLFDDSRLYSGKQSKRKELGHTLSANEFVTAMPVHSSTNASYPSGGDVPNNIPKSEFVVVDVDHRENGEAKTGVSADSAVDVSDSGGKSAVSNVEGSGKKLLGGETCSNGLDEDLGTEMEVIQRNEAVARVPNYTSHATLEVGHGDSTVKNKGPSSSADHGDVDTTVAFPLGIIQCEKTSSVVNGVEQNPLQLPSSYNSVKCIMGTTTSSAREDKNGNANKGNDVVMKQHHGSSTGAETTKTSTVTSASVLHSLYPMQHVSVLSIPPNRWIHTSLGSGDDEYKQAENSKKQHSSRRRQQWDDSNVIESRDSDAVFGNTNVLWKKFCGFTWMEFETPSRLTLQSRDSSDGKTRSFDENGNAVNQNYRVEASNERNRKSRRMKTNNDRNYIMSQNIEGHRGDKDIESLIKFIESNSDTKSKTKNNTTAQSNGPVSFSNKQRNSVRREDIVTNTKTRKDKGTEELQEEDKTSRNRVGSGKHGGKEKRSEDKAKLKKSNSLEEISKTKLEDLTAEKSEGGSSNSFSHMMLRGPKKHITVDDSELLAEKHDVADHNSWDVEQKQQCYSDGTATVSADEGMPTIVGRRKKTAGEEKRRGESLREDGVPTLTSATTSEETDFHVVTKKQRRKKRRSSSGGRATVSSGGLFGEDSRRPAGQYSQNQSYYQNKSESSSYYQRKGLAAGNSGFPPHDRTVAVDQDGSVVLYQYRHHRPRSPEHLRRKSTSSMPPSDKSDSSDLDSVHSLPVSSTTPKPTLDQTSTSSGSTPQASYADIARMASTAIPPAVTPSSCNINAGKWPAVTTAKTQSNPFPAITTSSVTPTPTVTVPPVAHNPQFITGPKLNIGAPPVSGSKTAVVVTSNTPNTPQHSNVNSNSTNSNCTNNTQQSSPPHVPVSVTEELPSNTALSQHGEQSNSSTGNTLPSRHRSHSPSDSCTKKDAMTNTTLDYKLMPVEEKVQVSAPPRTVERHPQPSNNIMNDYYPSLEESFVVDKLERKLGRCSNLTVVSNASSSSKTTLDEAPSTVAAPVVNIENIVRVSRNPHIASEAVVKHSAEHSAESTVIVPRRSLCTTAGGPASLESVPVASTNTVIMASNTSKPSEGVVKSRNSGRKYSAAGSTSSVRPPVIIMDEQEQESAYRENASSELTFGFEVNEQLLLSDVDGSRENSRSASTEPPVEEPVSPEANSVTRRVAPANEVPALGPISATSSIGEDFSARYREPVTPQVENHDKIVTFVGLAWDNILKEMSSTSVQTPGKVQYYSGQ